MLVRWISWSAFLLLISLSTLSGQEYEAPELQDGGPLWEHIESLINQDRLAEAEARLDELRFSGPPPARLLFLEAVILHRRGRYAESIEKLLDSLEYNLRDADAYNLIGLNLVHMGKERSAGPYFEAATKLDPEDRSARFYWSLHHLRDQKYDAAEAGFRELLRHHPDDVEGWTLLGVVLEQKSQEEEAIQAYREAIRLSSSETSTTAGSAPRFYLGRYLRFLGRYDESLEPLQAAIEVSPDSVEARNELGLVLIELQRYEEALEILLEAVEIAPRNRTSHYLLIRLYRKLGRQADVQREMEIYTELESEENAP